MFGLTRTLGKTTLLAGIPLTGAVAYASLTQIEWMILNKDDLKEEGIRLNINEDKLNTTFGILAAVYISAELWTMRRLLASAAARESLQVAQNLTVKKATKKAIEREAVKAALAAGIGKAVGKILLVDTVIWLVAGTIDLGLNFTDMTEEEQIELFDWMGPANIVEPVGGFSPLGDWVISPVLSWAFDLVPDSWVDSISSELWDAAKWLGLDKFVTETAESYIDSIDLEVSWWLIGRVLGAGVSEGVVIHAAFNPSKVFWICAELIILKTCWHHVAVPFARSLRA